MGQKRSHSQIIQKRKDNPKEWSTKKKVIILYTVLMVIYGIYSMVTGILTVISFTGAIVTYKRIADNLDNDIITDVQVKTNEKCSDDYESLFNYQWGGMQTGCDCNDAQSTSDYSDITQQLYTGSCNGNQTEAGCTTISSIPSQNFYLWDLNNVAQNICIKRQQNTPFYNNAPKENQCLSSEKQCGNSDYPNSLFCVDQSDDCPIYEFVFDTQSNTQKTDDGYEEIQLQQEGNPENPISIYINRYGQKQPISEIRVTEGDGVCYQNNQPNMEEDRSKYKLDQTEKEYCSEVDDRFQEISGDIQLGEIDYFTANGVYDDIKDLPGISLSNDYTYNTYTRTFLQWDLEYREELEEFINLNDQINLMTVSQYIVMIVNIFVCIIVSIILTIAQIYNLCGKDVKCISGEGQQEQQRIKKIKKILSYGSKAFQGPFIFWAFTIAYQNKDFLNNIADNEISDKQTNLEIQEIATEIEDSVFYDDLYMLIAFFLACLVDLGYYIYKLKRRRNKRKNQVIKISPQYNETKQDDKNSGEVEVLSIR